MTKNYTLTLEATGTFQCKKEEGGYYQPPIIIKEGSQITLDVPTSITQSAIFSLQKNSEQLENFINQFHSNGYMISKEQLKSAYWKVVDPSDIIGNAHI